MLISNRSLAFLLPLLLVGLPLAAWLDMRGITETLLSRQASDLNSAMSSIRGYYGNTVVGRIQASPWVSMHSGKQQIRVRPKPLQQHSA
jgi:hypothetical protein